MTIEKIISILVCITGLISAIRFRYFGKEAIEQRRKINRFFPKPFRQPEEDFDKLAVFLTQIGFLTIGVLAFLVGLANFLS